MFKTLAVPVYKIRGTQDPSRQANFILWWLIFVGYQHGSFFTFFLVRRILWWFLDSFWYIVHPVHKSTRHHIPKAPNLHIHQYRTSNSHTNILVRDREFLCISSVTVCSLEFRFVYPRLQVKWNIEEYHYGSWTICTRLSSDSLPS
jgi:hypothetical protein